MLIARQRNRQLELAGRCSAKSSAHSAVSGPAKTIPSDARSAPVTTSSPLMTCDPSRHAASLPSCVRRARERRDERGAHRAFGKQLAEQARDARRDDERVGLPFGAEEIAPDDLVADQAEHAARQRRRR